MDRSPDDGWEFWDAFATVADCAVAVLACTDDVQFFIEIPAELNAGGYLAVYTRPREREI